MVLAKLCQTFKELDPVHAKWWLNQMVWEHQKCLSNSHSLVDDVKISRSPSSVSSFQISRPSAYTTLTISRWFSFICRRAKTCGRSCPFDILSFYCRMWLRWTLFLHGLHIVCWGVLQQLLLWQLRSLIGSYCTQLAPLQPHLNQRVWSQCCRILLSDIIHAAVPDARLSDIKAALIHKIVTETITNDIINA